MPSSISSSDPARFARLTAADRPGIAQPVPVREVPVQPWLAICTAVLIVTPLLLAGWEWYWRAFGATPAYQNSDGLWAIERRRIDEGEGHATVLIGASRILFDVQLPVWEQMSGKRPIQLALEGTSPMFALEDLAADPKFNGRLIVGVAPDIFFSGYEYRKSVLKYHREESPAQRAGQWLSMRLLEPFFAAYDPDFALFPVIKRQMWPARPGLPPSMDVRKLSMTEADRNTHLWSKVETDPEYRELCRKIWAQDFDGPTPEEVAQAARTLEEQLRRAAAAVARLRARGVTVIFVRPPSDGAYLAFEDRVFPRASTWDALLARTGAPGIHFQDYPGLQGFYLPEWSHLSHADAERFTRALYRVIAGKFPAMEW
jgi:hypothetical protein